MRHVDPLTAAADATPADPALADLHEMGPGIVARQLGMLTRLAEIGMTLAEATERWALAAPEDREAAAPGGFQGDPGLLYSRVARAVRQTLMLQTRLLHDLPALSRAANHARIDREQARRERVQRVVTRAVRAEHDDPDAAEHLSDAVFERLRDEDFSDDILALPLGEAVARICRDLGLSPAWTAWAMEAATATTAPPPEPHAQTSLSFERRKRLEGDGQWVPPTEPDEPFEPARGAPSPCPPG